MVTRSTWVDVLSTLLAVTSPLLALAIAVQMARMFSAEGASLYTQGCVALAAFYGTHFAMLWIVRRIVRPSLLMALMRERDEVARYELRVR